MEDDQKEKYEVKLLRIDPTQLYLQWNPMKYYGPFNDAEYDKSLLNDEEKLFGHLCLVN